MIKVFALISLIILVCVECSTRIRTKCPRGRYGLQGGLTPCSPCPRGRYGSTSGLSSSSCTAQCGAGKYQDKLGQEDIDSCKPCPPNTWSSLNGVTSKKCTACPVGKYNLLWGATRSGACLVCIPGYMNANCMDIVTLTTKGNINGL